MNIDPDLDPNAVRIGPDVVCIEDQAVVIYSKRNMDRWVVREHRRPAIWFRGYKFYLHSKLHTEKPFAWKYTLWPWPEDDRQAPPYEIDFDEDYVMERERELKSGLAGEGVRWILLLFYPILGFFWSGVKDRLISLGFDPRTMTSVSVMLEFSLMLLLGIYAGWWGGGTPPLYTVLAVLILDVVFRYDAVLREKPRQPGFLEWCFRRLSDKSLT